MRSPISNAVEKWKMRLLENSIINDFQKIFKIWIRYVDDIFIIANKFFELPLLLEKINSYDKNVQFTVETEKYNILAFPAP